MTISRTFLKNLAVRAVMFAAAALAPLSYTQSDNTAMPIQFLDKTYHLAWTSEPTSSHSKHNSAIYLPKGETLPYYTHALIMEQELGVSSVANALLYFLEITRPEVIATDSNTIDRSEIINRIQALNTGQSLLIFVFNEHNQGREIITENNGRDILDLIEKPDAGDVFLVSVFREHDKERDEVVWDWLAFRYSLIHTADGQHGVRRFGYSRRHYGNAGVSDFLQAIDVSNPRSPAINTLISASIP